MNNEEYFLRSVEVGCRENLIFVGFADFFALDVQRGHLVVVQQLSNLALADRLGKSLHAHYFTSIVIQWKNAFFKTLPVTIQ
jgi:hypothetical protein